ncbi:MAG TPA: resolvase [bacterium]|jgi:hypothetical protein
MNDKSEKKFLGKKTLLAIDPGRDKCGVAVIDEDNEIQFRAVASKPDFRQAVIDLIGVFHPARVVIGDGTASEEVKHIVETFYAGDIISGQEVNSTLEARNLAWEKNPPVGLIRMLPRIFWPQPDGIDGWAAVVIGRRNLDESPL